MSVRPSVCLHENSRMIRGRIMKLYNYTWAQEYHRVETCAWPLTRSNWRVYITHMHRVQIKLHNVHLHNTYSCGILAYMRCCSLLLASTNPRGRLRLEFLWNYFALFLLLVSQTIPFGFIIGWTLNLVFRSERSYGIAVSMSVCPSRFKRLLCKVVKCKCIYKKTCAAKVWRLKYFLYISRLVWSGTCCKI